MFYQHYSLRAQHLFIVLVVYTRMQTEDASVGVCHIGHVGHLNKSMDYPWLHTFAFWLGVWLPAALSAVKLVSQEIVAVQWRSLSQIGCEVLSAHCVPAHYGCCWLPCDIMDYLCCCLVYLCIGVYATYRWHYSPPRGSSCTLRTSSLRHSRTCQRRARPSPWRQWGTVSMYVVYVVCAVWCVAVTYVSLNCIDPQLCYTYYSINSVAL